MGTDRSENAEVSDRETPELVPGETWRPRGRGFSRVITGVGLSPGGLRVIKYRTVNGEFDATEPEFRFWIERRFASPAWGRCEDHTKGRLP